MMWKRRRIKESREVLLAIQSVLYRTVNCASNGLIVFQGKPAFAMKSPQYLPNTLPYLKITLDVSYPFKNATSIGQKNKP